jgi:hypothetical protein
MDDASAFGVSDFAERSASGKFADASIDGRQIDVVRIEEATVPSHEPFVLWSRAFVMAAKNSWSRARQEVSRVFRTLVWAERRPALAQAGMAPPLICWSFSSSMFRYLLVDHTVPAMWRSLAAARLSADCEHIRVAIELSCHQSVQSVAPIW